MREPYVFSYGILGVKNLINTKLIKLPHDIGKSFPDYPENKNLAVTSKQILQWFLGFLDAEGCFSIQHNKSWTAAGFSFTIELHLDDIEILNKIAKTLGVGVVKRKKTITLLF